MNSIQRILIGLSVATLLPAGALAQKVTYDFGTASLSGLKTFAFKDTPVETTTEATTAYDSPFVEQRTHDAIATQLEARGMTRDARDPDMYVTTRRTFKTEYEVYAPVDWGLNYGYGWGWGPYYAGWGPWYGGGSWYTEERIIGTLIVDFENAATGELIWRGMAERHVHPLGSPSHRTKRVNEEVSKIFRKFPTGAVATSGSDIPVATDR